MQCALTVDTCLRLSFCMHHPVIVKSLQFLSGLSLRSLWWMMKDMLTVLLTCMIFFYVEGVTLTSVFCNFVTEASTTLSIFCFAVCTHHILSPFASGCTELTVEPLNWVRISEPTLEKVCKHSVHSVALSHTKGPRLSLVP